MLKIKDISIEILKEYENNPRNNDMAVDKVVESIKEFGFKVPIVVDKNNVIVAGHTRLKAAKRLALKKVPCIIADDLTPEQIKAFRLADNKVSEYASWDEQKLHTELLELKVIDFNIESFGFETKDIDISGVNTEEVLSKFEDTQSNEVVEDNFEIVVPEIPASSPGQIWQLGNHRLMCGDSTEKSDVERLMNGNKADMVFTDPPYNIAYEGGSKKREMIKNDKVNDFYSFLHKVYSNLFDFSKGGSPIYVTHADSERINFTKAFIDCGFYLSSVIIWVKNNATFGRQDYKWKHEPMLYGWNSQGTHKYYGEMNEDTVWEINRPSRSDEHPTMKPIELISRALNNSSKENDKVLDLFGGSGSTLIACEQLNRRCYMMELDPKYVDVIIKRWEEFTGKKAMLISG